MTAIIPYKILPEAVVAHQPDEFTITVVIPWLREVTAHHKRFRIPPWRDPENGNLIVVKGTRWAVPASVPEIFYYTATDPDGHTLARDPGDKTLIISWAPTPVPLPALMEELAIDPQTGQRPPNGRRPELWVPR